MKLKTILPVLFLVLLIGFAGCLQPKQETSAPKSIGIGSTKGVEITEFSSLSYIDSAEPLDVILYVQNKGDSTATNIKADIYQHSGFIRDADKATRIEGGDLAPPDKEFEIPGDVFSQSWPLKAPTVESDQTRSVISQVSYSYSSRASTNIQLVGKTEWDNRGGAGAFTTYSTSSEAPVTLKMIEVPAIRVSTPEKTKKVPIDILLENTGTGVIVGKDVTGFSLSVIKGDAKMSFAPLNMPTSWEDMGANIECSAVNDDGSITLFGIEQERSIRCYLTVPFDQAEDYSGYILETSINYDYSVHSNPLPITVRKLQ
jgi:hypothetical protein